MRRLFLLLALFVLVSSAAAQGPNPKPPVHGVHYSFERMVAERTVDDAHDRGIIRLVSYVYRPLIKPSGEVVVVLHGSTGGMVIAPAETYLGAAPSIGFFIERGYTVVVPMRRGRAESSGHYVEECAYQAGKCSLADYRELTASGLTDALASTEAVINQVVLKRLQPKQGRLVLWGSSRGGLLALRYAAAHPETVRGVVAVSMGWLSMTDKWPAEENRLRMSLQTSLLAEAGKLYKGPTLWVHADADPFYPEALTRQFFEAYTAAGGSGRYVQVRNHKLPTGHVPPVELWQADADKFLGALPQ
jgi:pimeloyl-ACP methyl ester carboxylesterase